MEKTWRGVDVQLEGCVWAFRDRLVRTFGGSERHLGIVGASMLKSGDPMGEVDLERSLDGGWSCLEFVAVRVPRSCVELRGVVLR